MSTEKYATLSMILPSIYVLKKTGKISFILVKLDDCHLLDYKFENIFCSESFAYYLIAFGELIE